MGINNSSNIDKRKNTDNTNNINNSNNINNKNSNNNNNNQYIDKKKTTLIYQDMRNIYCI